MQTPRIFIAYAPRAGLRCALAYLSSRHDAYGWFTGPSADATLASAYFVLDEYYTPRETRYIEVPPGELHAGAIDDEARCHELARLQDAVAHEWLFYRGDPGAERELALYAAAELACGGDVNLRFERLNRLSKGQANWTFYTPAFEHGVLETLSRRWPLDYRV